MLFFGGANSAPYEQRNLIYPRSIFMYGSWGVDCSEEGFSLTSGMLDTGESSSTIIAVVLSMGLGNLASIGPVLMVTPLFTIAMSNDLISFLK